MTKEQLIAQYEADIFAALNDKRTADIPDPDQFIRDASKLGINESEAEQMYRNVLEAVLNKSKKESDANSQEPPDPLIKTSLWITLVLSGLATAGVLALVINSMKKSGGAWTDYLIFLIVIALAIMSAGTALRGVVYVGISKLVEMHALMNLGFISEHEKWLCFRCGYECPHWSGSKSAKCPRCGTSMTVVTF